MYKRIEKETIGTTVTNDPYLVLEIYFGDEADTYRHMGFYYGDTNLLEIGTDYHTKRIGRMVLVDCEEHFENSGKLTKPSCPEGTLFYEMPREIECDAFRMDLFDNGVKFRLSSSNAVEYVKCGCVYFGFGTSDEIVEIIVAELTESDMTHIKEVLEEADKTRGKVFVFNGEDWVESDSVGAEE